MTFMGSTSNDAAFQAWMTDVTVPKQRPIVETVLSVVGTVSSLAVTGVGSFAQAGTITYKVFFIGLLGIVLLSSFAAPKRDKKEKEPEVVRVYMYGVSIDFNESLVYMTDVQSLDSMIINGDGSLQNYSSYSLQLKVFLEGTLAENNQTCAVIYSDNKKKLDKLYAKMRKKYMADKDKVLKQIAKEEFVFRKE